MMNRMEVLQTVLHFGITLFLLVAYVYTLAIGQADETLRNGLLLAVGWWFGAIGGKVKDKILGNGGNQNG